MSELLRGKVPDEQLSWFEPCLRCDHVRDEIRNFWCYKHEQYVDELEKSCEIRETLKVLLKQNGGSWYKEKYPLPSEFALESKEAEG